jgi:hypothetical protein
MGLQFTLTDTFTDTSLPQLFDDPIMSTGSLMLMDVNHSLGSFSGTPSHGSVIPNIAWTTANSMVSGAPGQSALNLSLFTNSVALPNVSFPLVERTSKKGIHFIKSQVNDTTPTANAEVTMPTAIFNYVSANLNHSYYFSTWQYFTRAFTTFGAPYPGIAGILNNTSNLLFSWQPGSANTIGGFAPQGTGSKYLGASTTGSGGMTTGASIQQAAVSGYSGANTTISNQFYFFGGQGGPYSGLHIGGSQILYRTYLEDLTVSGRTYAQVKAIDDTLYATATAPGGKINGDTFTAPAGYA